MKIQSFTGWRVGDRYFSDRSAAEEYVGMEKLRTILAECATTEGIAGVDCILNHLRENKHAWAEAVDQATTSTKPIPTPGTR